MMKTKKGFIAYGLTGLLALGLGIGSLIGVQFSGPKAAPANAAAGDPVTGLNLTLRGDGCKTGWVTTGTQTLSETSSGVYTARSTVILGQISIAAYNSWDDNRVYYSNFDSTSSNCASSIEDWNVHNSNSGDHNLYFNTRGVYDFTVTVTETDTAGTYSYSLAVNLVDSSYNVLCAAGDALATGWNTSKGAKYAFDYVSSGVRTLDVAVTSATGSFCIYDYGSWDNKLDSANVVWSQSTAAANFTQASSGNITPNTTFTVRIQVDKTVSPAKVYLNFTTSVSHNISLYNGTSLIGTQLAYEGANFSPIPVALAGFRFEGWYNDASFTSAYTPTAFTANASLYGRYITASAMRLYYFPGLDWNNWAGARIYGYHVISGTVTNDFTDTGADMTRDVTSSFYYIDLTADQIPSYVKFCEKNNEGNKTTDLVWNASNNFFVYQTATWSSLTDDQFQAYNAATSFLSSTASACSTLSVDSTLWTNIKAAVLGYSTGAQAILKNKTLVLGTGDAIDLAVTRYDFIVTKYSYENFLNRTIGGSGVSNVLTANSDGTFIFALGFIAFVSALGVAGVIILKKNRRRDYR